MSLDTSDSDLSLSSLFALPDDLPVSANAHLAMSSVLAIAVGAVITLPLYLAYLHFIVDRRPVQTPEQSLEAGLFAAFCIPVSQLLFGWTSRPSVHYMVPIFSSGIYLP